MSRKRYLVLQGQPKHQMGSRRQMNEKIVTGWKPHFADLWSRETLVIEHSLHQSPLFSEEAIAELIDQTPSEHYNLATMGADPLNGKWREGILGDATGKETMQAIKNGRLWLNIRHCQDFDPRYKKVLDQLFEEFEAHVPGLQTYKRNMGILVTSPKCQTLYHFDLPGQHLWQIKGRKKVYVYPNHAPFLTQKDREQVLMRETREEYPFKSWYDDYAEIYDLEPGQMAYWPIHGPHRVVNEDCLNISLTLEHWDTEVRNTYAVHYGNGVLRRALGLNPKNCTPDGLHVYPKAALTMAWKKLGFEKSRAFRDEVDFTIDTNQPLGYADIPMMIKA